MKRAQVRSAGVVLALFAASLVASATARGQGVRWVVDSKGSIAWWQIDPHMNHLWGTTCPQEPSWRAGEGRSSGWSGQIIPPTTGFSTVSDTLHVPLYPRHRARFVCPADAVQGTLVVGDTATWRDVQGRVAVSSDALTTGETMRDNFAKNAIFEVRQHPDLSFKVDSLVDMTRRADTVRGTVHGTFTFHGVTKPETASFKAFHEAGGVRVLAKFSVPAEALTEEFQVSKYALGLGVGTHIWRTLFMGVDMVLRPETSNTSRGSN
jgi:hypothetical protein